MASVSLSRIINGNMCIALLCTLWTEELGSTFDFLSLAVAPTSTSTYFVAE
jgi:hypothetical protein